MGKIKNFRKGCGLVKTISRVASWVLLLALFLTFTACNKSTGGSSSVDSSVASSEQNNSIESETSVESVESATSSSVSNESKVSSTSRTVTNSVGVQRKSEVNSNTNKNTYADIGLNMKNFNVTNKTLKIFVGPERTKSDFLSVNAVPGVVELIKAYYDLNIELVSCGDYNDWYTKLAMLSLSGQSPDIAFPLSESYPYDIAKGNVKALDGYFDWNEAVWDNTRDILNSMSWNGKHYHAVVNDGQFMSPVYYNPKIFKKNGVKTPRECVEDGTWTWQKMLDMAVELTQDTNGDGKTDLWGCGGMFFTDMYDSSGKPLVTVKGKTVTNNITDPVFANVAQFIYDLGPNGKYKVSTAFSHDNSDLFVSGQVAMDAGAHWRVAVTYKDMWKAGTIDVVPFPRMNSSSSYYKGGVPGSIVIFKNAKNIEGAKAFIWTSAYIQSAEGKTKLTAYGKKKGVNQDFANWLYADIPGLTDAQYHHIIDSIWDPENKYKMKSNPNTWIGWFNNGWDNGFQYAHQKQWSTIVNVYKNQFNAAIEETIETLNSITK